jgi:hypothetical protein
MEQISMTAGQARGKQLMDPVFSVASAAKEAAWPGTDPRESLMLPSGQFMMMRDSWLPFLQSMI